MNIIEHLKKLKVYENEHLTAINGNIARLARELVRRRKIEKTWIRNCRTFVKVKVDGEVKVYGIDNIRELDRFNST